MRNEIIKVTIFVIPCPPELLQGWFDPESYFKFPLSGNDNAGCVKGVEEDV
ncbi:MAG: hypothetical protein ACYSR0_07795 [Planctomycetota bacterium]